MVAIFLALIPYVGIGKEVGTILTGDLMVVTVIRGKRGIIVAYRSDRHSLYRSAVGTCILFLTVNGTRSISYGLAVIPHVGRGYRLGAVFARGLMVVSVIDGIGGIIMAGCREGLGLFCLAH